MQARSIRLSASGWWTAAAFAALAVCYLPVLNWLLGVWTTSVYDAHGAIVPFLAGAMIYARMHRPATAAGGIDTRPAPAGAAVIAAALLLLAAGRAADLHLLQGLSLIVAVHGTVLAFRGRDVFRMAFFPVCFLALMLPFNYPLSLAAGFPLRLVSTRLAAAMLRGAGIETAVQGTLIATPRFAMNIASPCSGLKTLSSLLVVGVFLAYLAQPRWPGRIALMAAIAPIAVIANGARNFAIGLLGHHAGREAALGFFHTFSGMAAFLSGVLALLGISLGLTWIERQKRV